MRQRVVAYITRQRDGRTELLVFDHRDRPKAGTQVPAGRLDPGESLEEGLLRELREETGLERVRVVRELVTWSTRYENHAFLVELVDPAPDSWEHEVAGDGNDAGLVFVFRWEHLEPELRLFNKVDPILEHL